MARKRPPADDKVDPRNAVGGSAESIRVFSGCSPLAILLAPTGSNIQTVNDSVGVGVRGPHARQRRLPVPDHRDRLG